MPSASLQRTGRLSEGSSKSLERLAGLTAESMKRLDAALDALCERLSVPQLGRIEWLDRYPWMARHRDAVVHRVKDNQNLILVISRFLPGLRTAIPIACAYAKLRPLHFSSLNLVSAFLWASTIMLVVTKLGPRAMERLGLHGWWGALVPAALVLLFFNWLGRPKKK